ncbi:MAG: hypothetical protein AAF573_18825 [Bacteroidota bacterium]
MSGSASSFHSRLYNDFKDIDTYSHQLIVDFYQQFEEDIQRLKFHEFFELQVTYIDALFEVAAYDNLLEVCDETIIAVIENNIQYHHGEDIYRKLLFRKAAAHYNLLEYHKAEFVLQELIKIDPDDFEAVRFYNKCQIQHPPKYVQHARSTALILFLFTAMIICFEMSYFGFGSEPNAMALLIEITRNVVFLGGWVVLIVGDGIFRYKTFMNTNDFAEAARRERQRIESVPVYSRK